MTIINVHTLFPVFFIRVHFINYYLSSFIHIVYLRKINAQQFHLLGIICHVMPV